MRTGEKDVLKKDDYLNDLYKIVESRNKEISQQLSSEGKPPKGRSQDNTNGEKAQESPNALSIIYLNLKNMKGYYSWSKTQAIITFFIAAASCVVGILLIVFTFVYSVTGKVALDKTIITAIGGLVTELSPELR